MTGRERTFFWICLLAAFFGALYLLREVLLPFVAGMAVAYFLDPVVERLVKAGCSRIIGTTITMLLFIVAVIFFALLLLPILNAQLLNLIEVVPLAVARFEPLIRGFFDQLNVSIDGAMGGDGTGTASMLEHIPSFAGAALAWLAELFGRVLRGGVAVANLLSLILITPVVIFYLLRDWTLMVDKIDSWLPQSEGRIIREQIAEIDRTLAAFVRGQGSVCLVLAAYYAVALSLAGLDFAVIVGIFAGLISFVPFVGAIIGGVVSIGLGMLQFQGWEPVAIIAALFIAGQLVEGNILIPLMVGDAVGLHPVWVIFALLAGGVLFGFVGVLLAVPAAAVVGVLSRFALARYLAGPLHLGGEVADQTQGKDEADGSGPDS